MESLLSFLLSQLFVFFTAFRPRCFTVSVPIPAKIGDGLRNMPKKSDGWKPNTGGLERGCSCSKSADFQVLIRSFEGIRALLSRSSSVVSSSSISLLKIIAR